MKKRKFIYLGLLATLPLLSSCDSDVPASDDISSGKATRWTFIGTGGQDVAEETRAISFGGNSGKTLYYNWKANDEVEVFKGGTRVGVLTATPTDFSDAVVNLSGYASWTGEFAVNDQLTYYVPSRDADYRGQDGTVGKVSTNYTYLKSTPKVNEVDQENKVVHVSFAKFNYAGAMAWLKFRNVNGDWLRPQKVIMKAEVGELVLVDKAATGVTTGELEINTVQKDDMYPYEILVAFRNTNGTDQATYAFTVFEGDNVYEAKNVSLSSTPANNVYNDTRYYAPAGIPTTINVSLVNQIQNWNGTEAIGSDIVMD